MSKFIKFGIFAGLFLAVSALVCADIMTPTETTVYFKQAGKEWNKPVEYSVNCYGYYQMWDDDVATLDKTEKLVYSYTASCPSYGCKVYDGYYLNYKVINRCDVTGTTDGKSFEIKNYAKTPVPENCSDLNQFIKYDGTKYYKSTAAYEKCYADGVKSSEECDKLMEEIPEKDILKDPSGNVLEAKCVENFEMGTLSVGKLFTDVDSTNQYYDAIKYVKDNGIVQGYGDGTFKPDDKINRAELVKIIVEAGVADDSMTETCDIKSVFSDLKNSEWYVQYICTAYNMGIINGYPDGTFKPANYINFVEAAKIIVNGFGMGYMLPVGDPWYKPYVLKLEDKKAIPLSISSLGKEITRGEMAEIVYRIKAEVTSKVSKTFGL
ncbi:MAG: S-layer homology domain-containing protein [Candidatus Gracilibacteria bacterium]|jgi:hypothetical protein